MSQDIINSAVATGCAEIITLPICTIKTNLQNHPNKNITIPMLVRDIYNKNGLSAFYRASLPAISGQMFSTSSKWFLYQELERRQYFQNRVLNGFLSGVVTSFFTHPIELVKVHWQMQTPLPTYSNLYRGYSKSFSKVAVGSCCYFPLNDYCKILCRTKFQHLSENQRAILASLGSGFLSTLIVHPIDYLKTRHMYGLVLYQGLNPQIYYKGLTVNLLRIVPHFTITMTIIDYLNRSFSKK